MTVDIEGLISAEMNSAPGGGIIMHDGWSKFSEDYSGLFVSFHQKVKNNIGRVASGMLKETTEAKETLEPNIVLLSVSPQNTIFEEDTDDLETTESSETDDNQREASNFKGETHLKHFKKIFEYYDCDFDMWTKAHLAENPSVNKKLARLVGFPHSACSNHLLNSELNSM